MLPGHISKVVRLRNIVDIKQLFLVERGTSRNRPGRRCDGSRVELCDLGFGQIQMAGPSEISTI